MDCVLYSVTTKAERNNQSAREKRLKNKIVQAKETLRILEAELEEEKQRMRELNRTVPRCIRCNDYLKRLQIEEGLLALNCGHVFCSI